MPRAAIGNICQVRLTITCIICSAQPGQVDAVIITCVFVGPSTDTLLPHRDGLLNPFESLNWILLPRDTN
jgi:hypothetical protein